MNGVGRVRAMTQTARSTLELSELAMPDTPPDGAILQVEAVGICGSDVGYYLQDPPEPRILGHENVGRIWSIGPIASKIWGLAEGDRVALEEYIGCFNCEWCRLGEYRFCWRSDVINNPDVLRYGWTPTTVAPGIWGGYAQYLYMPYGAVWHRVPDGMTDELATLFIAMSNGVQWTGVEGRLRAGQSILIQGPGQMGTACVVAARAMGAGTVIVTGLGADAGRLDICRRLGADVVIDVEASDARGRLLEATAGKGVDVVIDATTDSGAGPLQLAVDALKRQGGHLVLQGRGRIDGFPMDRILEKAVTLHVARGHSYRSVERGLEILASGRYPVELMHTHDLALSDAALAIAATRGELVDGRRGLHAAVLPWS